MARGDKKSNREAKKPKKEKPKAVATSSFGGVKGGAPAGGKTK